MFSLQVFLIKRLGVISIYKNFFITILVVLLILIIIKTNLFSYLAGGIKNLLENRNNSWMIRESKMKYIIAHLSNIRAIVIGYGPDKNNIDLLNKENQYFLYLYRYGIMGLFLLIVMLFYPLLTAIYSITY